MDMISVQDTFYNEYFEGVTEDTIFLLNRTMAHKAWTDEIDANSSSFFDLPDDSWIITSCSKSVGNWIDAYNDDDAKSVISYLRQSVNWADDINIKYFVKKEIVFQSKWIDFLTNWSDFVSAEDDCPIIIPEANKDQEAIIFRPIGDIQKIN